MQAEGGWLSGFGVEEKVTDNRAENAWRGTFKIRFPHKMVEKLFIHLHICLEENFNKDFKKQV